MHLGVYIARPAKDAVLGTILQTYAASYSTAFDFTSYRKLAASPSKAACGAGLLELGPLLRMILPRCPTGELLHSQLVRQLTATFEKHRHLKASASQSAEDCRQNRKLRPPPAPAAPP